VGSAPFPAGSGFPINFTDDRRWSARFRASSFQTSDHSQTARLEDRSMHLLDHAVILGYLLLTVGLGIWFSRHQSRAEFFKAGGSMGVLTVGLSVMATLFSSNSFAMYPSASYGGSLKLSLTLIAHSAIVPLIVWVFIPVYTRLKCQTAYEYLEQRFHVSVRCLASGLFVLLRIGWMASATFAASMIVANVMEINQVTVILGLGVVSIAYTMLGGLRAVMWTDVAQFFIFSATILIALVLLEQHNEGGFAGMLDIYFANPDNTIVDFTPSFELPYGSWAILIGVFLEALSAFGADQVAVQRYLSARSEKTSQWAFLLNMAGIWLVVPALLLIGVGLYAHYDAHPEELSPLLASHAEEIGKRIDSQQLAPDASPRERVIAAGLSDQVMPQFVQSYFPAGMKGLFLAALLAAIMSSIDSGIHSVTTAIIVDFRDRFRPPADSADERQDLWMIRSLILLIGSIAIVLACLVGHLGNVFDIGKKLMAAFGGPLLAVFLLALFSRRASSRGVFSGALLAAPLTLWAMYRFDHWFSVWFWPLGFFLALILSYILSLAFPDRVVKNEMTFRGVIEHTKPKP
jgi:SSS family transporter